MLRVAWSRNQTKPHLWCVCKRSELFTFVFSHDESIFIPMWKILSKLHDSVASYPIVWRFLLQSCCRRCCCCCLEIAIFFIIFFSLDVFLSSGYDSDFAFCPCRCSTDYTHCITFTGKQYNCVRYSWCSNWIYGTKRQNLANFFIFLCDSFASTAIIDCHKLIIISKWLSFRLEMMAN